MAKIQTPLEIDKAQILKAYRAAIRLKYSLAADAELAVVIPEIERRIDEAWQSGKAITLNPGEVFEDLN